jgi:predicted small metal-binding protein
MAGQNTKHIHCVVPGCGFEASASTEEDLMKKVATHATQDHGLKEISPELSAQVKAAITTR